MASPPRRSRPGLWTRLKRLLGLEAKPPPPPPDPPEEDPALVAVGAPRKPPPAGGVALDVPEEPADTDARAPGPEV